MNELTVVEKCPLCGLKKRILLHKPIKDKIQSKIFRCLNCDLLYNGIRLINKNSQLLDDKFIYTEKRFLQWKTLYLNKIKNIS